jgi:hypothetical protein
VAPCVVGKVVSPQGRPCRSWVRVGADLSSWKGQGSVQDPAGGCVTLAIGLPPGDPHLPLACGHRRPAFRAPQSLHKLMCCTHKQPNCIRVPRATSSLLCRGLSRGQAWSPSLTVLGHLASHRSCELCEKLGGCRFEMALYLPGLSHHNTAT